MDLKIPHIMYISDPNGERIGLYYLGGEPEENKINLNNFGNFADLRNKKIDEIIYGSDLS